MVGAGWSFWIDVGGTFTDCIGRDGSGGLHTCKLLSSGVFHGWVGPGSSGKIILDAARRDDPDGFFEGYRVDLVAGKGQDAATGLGVASFERGSGRIELTDVPDPPLAVGMGYRLCSDRPVPVTAICYVLGLVRGAGPGPVSIRLGTTRGTNALLERRGAATALVTTAGFGDLPLIGTQERPKLFELDIRKPEPLYERVVTLSERVGLEGGGGGECQAVVLRSLERDEVVDALAPLATAGIGSIAICLLNAYVDPAHERLVAEVAREMGFEQVSVSSEVSPGMGMVGRCDTTVVDAYLTPVVRDYVDDIVGLLPEARIKMMTNAGGLVDAAQFSGKESLLSGPAGGVVGCARVACEAGIKKIITFDMGGTSTDVSHYDGQFEYQYETKKAGTRIVTPMLAIETVAAGGGSICAFDGHKLTVGPTSAGAEPGPACYGAGGPLTITDANLRLKRILPEFFPFSLDSEAVDGRLRELQGQISRDTGGVMSLDEIAEGCIRIVNESMSAAIRSISLDRGYDVRYYTLVTFGGAGGQHACGVARRLGMGRVLIPPHASLLSAYGIGLANVKRMGQISVLAPLTEGRLAELRLGLDGLAERLRGQVMAEGVSEGCIRPATVYLDLRYMGQESTLAVSVESATEGAMDRHHWREAFERLHGQLYGYVHGDRSLEIVNARVEVVGESNVEPPGAGMVEEGRCDRLPERRVVFDGRSLETAVHRREQLGAGRRIDGPALIVEANSVTVVEPGWQAEVDAWGNLLLGDEEGGTAGLQASADVDPVNLEIFHNRFAHIAEQMGVVLRRTALSTNVKERLDFSCAVFDSAGGLVANAPHMPVHLGGMSECVRCLIEDVPDIAVGDVLLTNDPFRGGSHLPDITVVTPVFDEAGRDILFYTASRAHHAEIGGVRPGSMAPFSRSLAEEGVLLRAFRVVAGGEPQFEALRRSLTEASWPSRSPDENLADISAAIAANQMGAIQLGEMSAREGRDVVQAYMGHIQRAAEQKTRSAIGRIADGRFSFTDHLDDGAPIAVTIDVRGDGAVIDFSGTGPVLANNLNANSAIVNSAVLYCLRCLMAEDIPLNGGVLNAVQVIVPTSLLNPPAVDDPSQCPAVAGGNVETSQRIVDVVFGALKVVAASQGTMNNLIFGDGQFAYYETIAGGAGAGPGFDGAHAVHTHMTNTRLTDPEVLERRYPVRLRRFEIRRDSGGAGRFRGGDGVIREFEFLASLEVSLVTQRRRYAPYGLEGGGPGKKGINRLRRLDGDGDELLDSCCQFEVSVGDVLTVETPGGGGWGWGSS